MVAATFRQLYRRMIMYTAKIASSGVPIDRKTAPMPSSPPMTAHMRSDGPAGSQSSSVTARVSKNRNGTSAMIRCSSSISNPS